MRTTISIPNEFADKIKSSLGVKGFNTLNEYVLNLIRVDQQQNDVPDNTIAGQVARLQVNSPKHANLLAEIEKATEDNAKAFGQAAYGNNEEKSEWPPSYLGKPLSGRKAQCPICYESVPIEFSTAHYSKKHGDI